MKKLLILLVLAGFAASGQNIPVVPVEFLDIHYTRTDENVTLTWRTASEIQNDYFTIQNSIDGETWENIGTVFGSGTTNFISTYKFSHVNPLQSYYRIWQTDYDSTSKIVVVIRVNGYVIRDVLYYDLQGRPVEKHYPSIKIEVRDTSAGIEKRLVK